MCAARQDRVGALHATVRVYPLSGSSEAPASPSLTTTAVRGFLWSALSLGSSSVIAFLITLVLARILLPRDFGLVAAGLTIIALLELGLDLGVGAAVVYEQERGVTDRVRSAFTLNLLFAVLLTAIGVLLAPGIAAFFHSSDGTSLIRVLFLYLLLRGAGQAQYAVLQRDLRFRERTVVDIAQVSMRAAVSIALALYGAGAWSIAFGLLAAETTRMVLAHYFVRIVPKWRLDLRVVRVLLTFGASVLGLKAAGALLYNSDYLIVGNRLGTTELGFYSIAMRLPALIIDSVGWIFSAVLFALYSRARVLGMSAFRANMLRALRFTTLFGFSAGTGLAIVAPTAVPLLFSERWSAAVPPAVLLALATGVSSIGYASGDIFPALGRPGTLLRLTASMVAVAVVGFWLAAPAGITAVAAVHLAFQIVFAALRLRAANRLLNVRWIDDLRAMAPALGSSVGICCTALPVSLLLPRNAAGLAATVLAGIAGASLALLVFGRPAVRDIRLLLRSIRTNQS